MRTPRSCCPLRYQIRVQLSCRTRIIRRTAWAEHRQCTTRTAGSYSGATRGGIAQARNFLARKYIKRTFWVDVGVDGGKSGGWLGGRIRRHVRGRIHADHFSAGDNPRTKKQPGFTAPAVCCCRKQRRLIQNLYRSVTRIDQRCDGLSFLVRREIRRRVRTSLHQQRLVLEMS